MSNDNDRSLSDMEEALAADDASTQRQYLIRKVAKISNRLDNGMSEKVDRNTMFHKAFKKWSIRLIFIVGPAALAFIGFLINRVYL